MSRRSTARAYALSLVGLMIASAAALGADKVTRYARFQINNATAYAIVEGDNVRQIDGDLFGTWKPSERTYPLSSVKLLAPVARPSKVLALAGSYKSHLGAGDVITTVTTTTKVTTSGQTGQTTSDSKTAVET